MKKFSKLMLGVVASLLVFVSVPAMAKAAPNCPTGWTSSYSSTTVYDSYGNINISGLKKDSKITDVKSSNKAIVEFTRVHKYRNTYSGSYSDGTPSYSNTYYYADIQFKVKKVGTATISYKVDGVKYTTKITMKAYKNRLETLKITGLKSGNNIATGFAKNNWSNYKNTAARSKIRIEAKVKTGCTIDNIRFYNRNTGKSLQYYPGSAKRSAVLNAPGVKATDSWYVSVGGYDSKEGVYRYYEARANY